MKSPKNNVEPIIINKAKELGASLAGIASIADLKASPSYMAYAENPFYESYPPDDPNYFKFKGVEWHTEHKSDIGTRTRLVEHEGTRVYTGQWGHAQAVEAAAHLDG